MTKSKWEIYKETHNNSLVSPLDLFRSDTKYVDDDLFDIRISKCKSCPEVIKLTTQCKKCGCFMLVKAKMENATCPMGKW